MKHSLDVKVYYEDTDSMGVVYYANYLKYYERGRSELIEALGQPISLWNEQGFNFAVFKADIRYHKPARLADRLRVETEIVPGSPFRLKMKQIVYRDGEMLNEALIQLVCLDGEFQLQEFPDSLLPIVLCSDSE